VSWKQVDIGGAAMWSKTGETELHLYPPNGTLWSEVDRGTLPGFTPEGRQQYGASDNKYLLRLVGAISERLQEI